MSQVFVPASQPFTKVASSTKRRPSWRVMWVTMAMPSTTPRQVTADLNTSLQAVLSSQFPKGLYSHQAEAIRAVLKGHDVCLATQTASGKSLVFMTAAADLM